LNGSILSEHRASHAANDYSIAAHADDKVQQLLLLSPRNSVEGHVSLLRQTQCRLILTTDVLPHVVNNILQQISIPRASPPALKEWIDFQEVVPPFKYGIAFEEARFQTFVILHTSGSTGLSLYPI
jgi:acyl-coenzyme A synthetase/AMP-(fatty) acid ligase